MIEKKELYVLDLLNYFIESIHDDILIADSKGNVLLVSNSWECKHGISANDAVGKNVAELEHNKIFKPSVTLEVLKHKKKIEMLQFNKKGERILVTGVPIFGENGEIKWVISYSSWDIVNFEILKDKYYRLEDLMKKYSKEIEKLKSGEKMLPGIVGESPQMKSIINLINRIAKMESNILITGETGVGKSLIAKKIHEVSNRKDKAFIEINCGAIPETLIESELFGYEEGAFTGAKKGGKVGLIELAQDGTLFLDEIGELPINLQSKLLKVIQDKELYKIGGTKPIIVNFRLITATNRDLKTQVEEKKFRVDLYFRIGVVRIQIPPLRDRKEDLKELINIFIAKFNKKYNTKKVFSEESISVLMSCQWPGNVRELENVLEQIIVTSDSDYVTTLDLPKDILTHNNATDTCVTNLKEALDYYEGKIVKNAYKAYKSTVKVSEVLGISQATAVRKIKKYVKGFNNE